MASCSQKSAAKANLRDKRNPEDELEAGQILKRYKEKSEEKETRKEQIGGRVELLETKSDHGKFISVEGLDETPDFVEEHAVPKKTIFVARLPRETEISDIIDFFKDVGEVVRIRFQATANGNYVDQAFVEFASANQAKKVLEKKKGEYLHNRSIFLDVALKGTRRCFPPKYCIDHKV